FVSMNAWEANLRLDSLVDLVCLSLRTGAIAEYTVSISWDLYNRNISGKCKVVFDDPYYFLMMHIVKMAMRDLRHTSPEFDGKIHFVFDDGNSAERHAQKHFHLLKKFSPKEMRRHIGALTFEDDKTCPPLQAADMIAWHTRRALAGFPKDEDGSRRTRYEKLRSATQSGIRGEAMEDLLEQFNRDVNALTEELEAGRVIVVMDEDD
ncbi:MAG: DUF3800 domain-containing protein, partial [Acidobacteriota bacterium]|nr:DUF3800 domain-containing protein [Acidobacteriota bacterium]